jgi:hypothetical protein
MYIEKVLPWKSRDWIAPHPDEIARIRKAAGTHEDVEADAGVLGGPNGEASEEEKETEETGHKETAAA